MSWHTSAILIEGDHTARAPELLALLGFPGLRHTSDVDGDTAGSSRLEGKAVGTVGGWTLLWDPTMFLGEDLSGAMETGLWSASVDAALLRMSRESGIYSFLTEGASGTHGFAWYRNGRRQRLWLSQEGAVILDEGAQLPEEAEAGDEESDDEQRLFVLMQKLTGIAIADTLPLTYRLYA